MLLSELCPSQAPASTCMCCHHCNFPLHLPTSQPSYCTPFALQATSALDTITEKRIQVGRRAGVEGGRLPCMQQVA
jgi:hypothetical protein